VYGFDLALLRLLCKPINTLSYVLSRVRQFKDRKHSLSIVNIVLSVSLELRAIVLVSELDIPAYV